MDKPKETGHSTERLKNTGQKFDAVKQAVQEQGRETIPQAQSAIPTDWLSLSSSQFAKAAPTVKEVNKRVSEEVETDTQAKSGKYTEAIENNTPKLTPEYTKKNTLKLSLEDYIERAGKADKPTILKKTDDWDKALTAFLTKSEGTKALFLDFDGTMARFTTTPQETLAVHGFLSAVKTFLDKGCKVADVTGRPINEDTGILAALKRSGADEDLINRLDISGSHGVEHRGPETEGKEQIREEIQPFIEPQRKVLNKLKDLIKMDKELKGLDISFEIKVLGATIHYREVPEPQRQKVKDALAKLLSTFLPEKSDNTNFSLLEDQNNEDYKKFTYNSATESFEIRLNPATSKVEISKGTAVKSLAEKWEVKAAIAFGDDTTDLDMQKRLAELNLTATAFVGVKHSETPEEILKNSTIVVEGQESAVGLLLNMAELFEKQN